MTRYVRYDPATGNIISNQEVIGSPEDEKAPLKIFAGSILKVGAPVDITANVVDLSSKMVKPGVPKNLHVLPSGRTAIVQGGQAPTGAKLAQGSTAVLATQPKTAI